MRVNARFRAGQADISTSALYFFSIQVASSILGRTLQLGGQLFAIREAHILVRSPFRRGRPQVAEEQSRSSPSNSNCSPASIGLHALTTTLRIGQELARTGRDGELLGLADSDQWSWKSSITGLKRVATMAVMNSTLRT